MSITLLALCSLGLFCNLILVKGYDIQMRKEEFSMMYSIGISRNKQFLILFYELMADVILGGIFAIVGSILGVKVLEYYGSVGDNAITNMMIDSCAIYVVTLVVILSIYMKLVLRKIKIM